MWQLPLLEEDIIFQSFKKLHSHQTENLGNPTARILGLLPTIFSLRLSEIIPTSGNIQSVLFENCLLLYVRHMVAMRQSWFFTSARFAVPIIRASERTDENLTEKYTLSLALWEIPETQSLKV